MKRIVPLLSAVFVIITLAAEGLSVQAYADSLTEMEIPASCLTAENVPREKRIFTYTLTAASDGQPMPEKSDEKKKTVRMNGSGKIRFGTISFDHPDVYSYVVRETTEEWKNFRRDHNVYKVEIAVDSAGRPHMVVRNQKGEKVERIEFVNSFYLDKGYRSPKMGDSFRLIGYVLLLLTGTLLLAAAVLNRRYKNRTISAGGVKDGKKN